MSINIIRRDGNEDKFTNDFLVYLRTGKSLGKYVNGDTVAAAGKSAAEVLYEAAREQIDPIYNTPSALLTSNLAVGYHEVGESVALQLSSAYSQNDGGVSTTFQLNKNASFLSSSNPYTDNIHIPASAITYRSIYDYLAGSNQKVDNLGNLTNNPIGAGNMMSNILSVIGYYKLWYGPLPAAPTIGSDIRNAGYKFEPEGKSFILNTGSMYRWFTIASRTPLRDVIDLETNLNVKDGYVLTGITTVPDANGTNVSYYVYVMTNGIPYSTSHRHQFTVQ